LKPSNMGLGGSVVSSVPQR